MSATVSSNTAATNDSLDKRWAVWVGRVLSAVPVMMLVSSGAMKLARAPQLVEMWSGKFGYVESAMRPIGLLELACVALFVVPRTAVLGALLLTAYLGGAVATHVRVADPFLMPVVVGVLVWAGLYLRDARVRALLPLRSSTTRS